MAPKTVSQFELNKCVGKGATASVFLGYEPISRNKVAIKILKHTENSVRTIRHEMKTMQLLAHENVAQLYTTIHQPGCTYLVMELIGGGELFDTVKAWKKDKRERLTFHYFNQLMTGLKFLHSAGFAHRDLKLENLLLTTDGLLKIADFGVTKSLEFNPMRTCCGSPDYIAPEIIQQVAGYDGRLADLWSSGVIFYAMMCGEFPFENASNILKGLYKTTKWFPRLAKETVLDKILVVNPKQRIQSVEEITNSEWMQAFARQRNAFSMYLDVNKEFADSKELLTKIALKQKLTREETKQKIVFLCRKFFLRVLVMIKVVLSLRRPSIKGPPRNVVQVFVDRLYGALKILCDSSHASSPSTPSLDIAVDWCSIRDSQAYVLHYSLLGESGRADLAKLTDDERLATFINMYHVLLIHGYVAWGKHLSAMPKDKQNEFFDAATLVVGYMQFSLNDIFHGILRGNPKSGGGLFSKVHTQISDVDIEKGSLVTEHVNPLIHCCLSHMSTGGPLIAVYDAASVHAQMNTVATQYLQSQVSIDKKDLFLPSFMKDYSMDFPKSPKDVIAWVRGFLQPDMQQRLDSICEHGVCKVKYKSKETAFEFRRHIYGKMVKDYQANQTKRFLWSEDKKEAWIREHPDPFELKRTADHFRRRLSSQSSQEEENGLTRSASIDKRIEASIDDIEMKKNPKSPEKSPTKSPEKSPTKKASPKRSTKKTLAGQGDDYAGATLLSPSSDAPQKSPPKSPEKSPKKSPEKSPTKKASSKTSIKSTSAGQGDDCEGEKLLSPSSEARKEKKSSKKKSTSKSSLERQCSVSPERQCSVSPERQCSSSTPLPQDTAEVLTSPQSEESRRRATEHGWSQLHSPAPIYDSENLDLEKEALRVHNLTSERKKGRSEGKSGKGSFAQSGIEQDEKKDGRKEEKKEVGERRKEGKPFERSGSSDWSRTGSVEEKMQDSTDITRTGSAGSAKSSGSTGSSFSAFSTVSAVSKKTRMAVNEYKETDQESNEKLARLALAEIGDAVKEITALEQTISPVVQIDQGQALVFLPSRDIQGEGEFVKLDVESRQALMQDLQLASRTLLMHHSCHAKLMLQLKKQPEIKVRYSERKSRQSSISTSVSSFCCIA